MYHKPVSSFPDCKKYRKFGWQNSRTGEKHTGDDYPATVGSFVCAVLDGVVVLSEELTGFGALNPSKRGGCVIIKHQTTNSLGVPRDFFAVYGHLNRWSQLGDRVLTGQVIGTVRNFSNEGIPCPHLHFGIYTNPSLPTRHIGYSQSLQGYHDPDVWLSTYASGTNHSIPPSSAEWEPLLPGDVTRE